MGQQRWRAGSNAEEGGVVSGVAEVGWRAGTNAEEGGVVQG